MHIRNTGESFPRPFPRLQRPRRLRRGTFCSDVKRRTFTSCPPSPLRKPAHGLLPAAATPVSNASACWRPSSRLHRYRGTPTTAPVASPHTPSLDVAPLPVLLRCGLFASPAAGHAKSQTQSCRGPSPAFRSPESSGAATTRPLRACTWLYTSPAIPPGIFPPAFSTTSDPAIRCGAHPPPSSSPQPRPF
jgi:hypothetical protein